MAINYATQFSRKRIVPQSEPLPGKEQVQNNAGGHVFKLDLWSTLDRFLILGAEGGTYYVGERSLVKQNHDNIIKCIHVDGVRVVKRIVEISQAGRAPKNDPAIFALALVFTHGEELAKIAAVEALPEVCRIGTHLFHFCDYASALRGWGHSLRRAVARWYTGQPYERLALQVIKYQSRDKWSHRDALRLAHPKSDDQALQAIFRWIVGGVEALGKRSLEVRIKSEKVSKNYPSVKRYLPEIIDAFEQAKQAKSDKEIVKLITEHQLPRECIPTQFLNSVEVWDALLVNMPMTAMIRNLAKMTAIGLVKPMSAATSKVVQMLGDAEALRKARIHPINVLLALRTYEQGHGEKGSLSWEPVQSVVGALDKAFYGAFPNVESTGKNILFALDVSGSMGSPCGGLPLSCSEMTAALALVLASTEKNYHIMGFADRFRPLPIRPGMSLREAGDCIKGLTFGSTDCSLPFTWATNNKVNVDGFVTMTDNETWSGRIHPSVAIESYRRQFVHDARSIVIGMTATEFTINDPSDALGLDIAGFDAGIPVLVNDFIQGPKTVVETSASAPRKRKVARKVKL